MNNEIKFNIEFETTTQVAEADRGWLWLQINVANAQQDDGKYQVHFGEDLQVKTPDGKVIVSVSILNLVEKLIAHARATPRAQDFLTRHPNKG